MPSGHYVDDRQKFAHDHLRVKDVDPQRRGSPVSTGSPGYTMACLSGCCHARRRWPQGQETARLLGKLPRNALPSSSCAQPVGTLSYPGAGAALHIHSTSSMHHLVLSECRSCAIPIHTNKCSRRSSSSMHPPSCPGVGIVLHTRTYTCAHTHKHTGTHADAAAAASSSSFPPVLSRRGSCAPYTAAARTRSASAHSYTSYTYTRTHLATSQNTHGLGLSIHPHPTNAPGCRAATTSALMYSRAGT